jgi:drug/metabolite transporter (DMT)-like permease
MDNIFDNRRKAIFWMVTNCFFGASVNVLVKFLSNDLPIPLIVTTYNFGCALIVGAMMLAFNISPKTKIFHLHFYRAAFCTIAYLIYFSAMKTIAIANAVAITFIDPMLTCLFAYILLKDKIEKDNLIGLIAGFLGVLLIIKPGSSLFQFNSLIILVSTIFWALSNVIIKLITQTEHSLIQIFYMSLIAGLISLAVTYFGNYNLILPSKDNYILLSFTALMTLLNYYAIYKAFSLANPSEIMPFFFANIIFSEIFGSYFFGEGHDMFEAIGILIIIATNIYLLIRSKMQNNSKQFS